MKCPFCGMYEVKRLKGTLYICLKCLEKFDKRELGKTK